MKNCELWAEDKWTFYRILSDDWPTARLSKSSLNLTYRFTFEQNWLWRTIWYTEEERTKYLPSIPLLKRKCFAGIFAVRHLIVTRLEYKIARGLFFVSHNWRTLNNCQQLVIVLVPFHPNDKLNNGKQTLIHAPQGKKDLYIHLWVKGTCSRRGHVFNPA